MKARRPEPAEICHKNMRFLITDRPTDSSLDKYLMELEKHGVKDVVRVCEPTYSKDRLASSGIVVRDWEFDDGSPPPPEIVQEWFALLKSRFYEDPGCCIAVHCVAGLGRAPVMVAIALMEAGLKYEDAVEMIREKRRGAINTKQLAYLENYRAKSRLREKNGKKGGNGNHANCSILWFMPTLNKPICVLIDNKQLIFTYFLFVVYSSKSVSSLPTNFVKLYKTWTIQHNLILFKT